MRYDEMQEVLEMLQVQECEVRAAGHEEYAHSDENTFANFERVAADLGLSREEVLWVYLRKHLDGILAWINGARSQRENVQGRIKDARMYLALLAGMALERESEEHP